MTQIAGRSSDPGSATAALGARYNLKGILAMIAANAVLSANDACLKLAAGSLPMGELVAIRNGFGTLAALLVLAVLGTGGALGRLPVRLMVVRGATDVAGSLLFIAALLAMPFADAVAIGQCLPLVITAAAALLLGESVGWRRWLAAIAGFVGVLLIVKPGSSAFAPASLLALGSVLAIAVRDLVTRRIPPGISAVLLSAISMATVMAAGCTMAAFEQWRMPQMAELALLAVAGLGLFVGYMLLVTAMRTGEVAAVVPFRYTLVVWAILGGWLLWGELPDAVTVTGTLIVIVAGLYTLHREQVRRRAGQP